MILTTTTLDSQDYEQRDLLTVVVDRDLTTPQVDAQTYADLYEMAKEELRSQAWRALADGVMDLHFTPQIVYQDGQACRILLHATGMMVKEKSAF